MALISNWLNIGFVYYLRVNISCIIKQYYNMEIKDYIFGMMFLKRLSDAFDEARLAAAGREDLANKVIHEEAESNRPGWDISSFDETGSPIQIEVKSSVSSAIKSLVITSNEWAAASYKGDTYYLYLVTGVSKGGANKIEILQNPFKLNSSGKVELEVLSYHLKLGG